MSERKLFPRLLRFFGLLRRFTFRNSRESFDFVARIDELYCATGSVLKTVLRFQTRQDSGCYLAMLY